MAEPEFVDYVPEWAKNLKPGEDDILAETPAFRRLSAAPKPPEVTPETGGSKIAAEIVLASRSDDTGLMLATAKCRFPRWILAEINTHRQLSRNAASSRAIPTEKLLRRVLDDPAVPVRWGRNQKGMQAREEIPAEDAEQAEAIWRNVRHFCVDASRMLGTKFQVAKELTNRLVEPWMWMETLVSFTASANLFKLRCHPDAQPEFQVLANALRDAALGAAPTAQILRPGEWHLPFLRPEDMGRPLDERKAISTARCARVSYYLPEDGKLSDPESDRALYSRLASSGHFSPFEHVATPLPLPVWCGNFQGWLQHRKELPGESGGDPVEAFAATPREAIAMLTADRERVARWHELRNRAFGVLCPPNDE